MNEINTELKKMAAAAESPVKVCADCRWFAKSVVGFPLCIRNVRVTRDKITGELETTGQVGCREQRSKRIFKADRHCGPEARFFEPKQPES